MYNVRGISFKHRFQGFVNGEVAKESGINLDGILSPYTLWNMPKGTAFVFPKPDDPIEARRVEQGEMYQRLAEDPRFIQVVLYCNN